MINNHVLSEVRTNNAIEALTRQVADIKAALPNNFTESKDWAFDSDPVSRIEWLKTFHAEHRAEIERLSEECCCWKETSDMLLKEHVANLVERIAAMLEKEDCYIIADKIRKGEWK